MKPIIRYRWFHVLTQKLNLIMELVHRLRNTLRFSEVGGILGSKPFDPPLNPTLINKSKHIIIYMDVINCVTTAASRVRVRIHILMLGHFILMLFQLPLP